jgi:AraC-like DNA-binding protein
MRTAPTLGDAILDLCTNQHRYIRGAVAYLIVQEDVALWGYALHGPLPDGAFHMCDGAVGIACAMLKEIVGRQPEQVLLARRPPKDDGPFRRIHEAPVRFHAEQHAVVIRRAWLSLPQPTADPALRRLLQQQVRAYWAREQPEIAERVRRLLAGRVLSHQASAAAVAQDLEMTQRTLNRRLEAHGTTFRDLLGDVRYDAACQLLATTRMPLTDIAMALGYATPSAFSRAFSGWSGISPSAWRAAQGPRTAT